MTVSDILPSIECGSKNQIILAVIGGVNLLYLSGSFTTSVLGPAMELSAQPDLSTPLYKLAWRSMTISTLAGCCFLGFLGWWDCVGLTSDCAGSQCW